MASQEFFHACPDLLCVIGFDGVLRELSNSWKEALGYSRAELLAKPALDLVHPDDREYTATWARHLLRPKARPVQFENRCCRRDGSTLRLWWHLAAIREQRIVCASARDITERHYFERELQDQLFLAQKLETAGRLVAAVAHDVNNLLTVINGHVGFLLQDVDVDDPRRLDVEGIREVSAQTGMLTRQLLNFCRRSPQKRAEPVDLNGIIRDMARMLSCIAGKDIKLELRLAKDLGMAFGDTGEFSQVIVNLAVNARDAMPDGGALTLETASVMTGPEEPVADLEPGAYVVLTVTDTGCGMDRATMSQLFTPFFTTKAPDHGCGLGLATVARIVKAAGGAIGVQSSPGSGTSFKVYWPEFAS
jgi:PAS domain S-box-containing protein